MRALDAASEALEELNLCVMEVADGVGLADAVTRFAALQSLDLAVQEWGSPLPLGGKNLAHRVTINTVF